MCAYASAGDKMDIYISINPILGRGLMFPTPVFQTIYIKQEAIDL